MFGRKKRAEAICDRLRNLSKDDFTFVLNSHETVRCNFKEYGVFTSVDVIKTLSGKTLYQVVLPNHTTKSYKSMNGAYVCDFSQQEHIVDIDENIYKTMKHNLNGYNVVEFTAYVLTAILSDSLRKDLAWLRDYLGVCNFNARDYCFYKERCDFSPIVPGLDADEFSNNDTEGFIGNIRTYLMDAYGVK